MSVRPLSMTARMRMATTVPIESNRARPRGWRPPG